MRLLTVMLFLLTPLWGVRMLGSLEAPQATLLGIDISHHQKRIDWHTVAEHNDLQFAFVKATEGGDFRDTLFAENWEMLHQMGIRRGAYHFFRPNKRGVDQAKHFLQTVELRPGDLAPVLDLETTDRMPVAIVLREARAWLEAVEQALNVRPILYTNQNFYERHLKGVFDNYPLWIARYSSSAPELSTASWHFWQFSEKGRVTGIAPLVDLNLFRGTPEMLDRLCWFPAEGLPLARTETSAP